MAITMQVVCCALAVLVFAAEASPLYFVRDGPVPYTEHYFDQFIDHFNFVSNGQKTFKQRYLMQDKWWDRGVGPIFYYAGNEGDIDDFWNNTGFMFDIAPQFGALVVFGEHRYYGKSLPFGEASFSPDRMGLLSVEQALADHAALIRALKQQLNASSCPVIAFGGSYGGMLSAYLRFKYPNVVRGSIAASAPIYMLDPAFPRNFFFSHVTQDFQAVDPKCVSRVREAFVLLDRLAAQGASGYQQMQQTFGLCQAPANSSEYRHLLGWVRNAFTYLAMLDYPYPTDFMGSLPAFPVKTACSKILAATDALSGLVQASQIYYGGEQSGKGSSGCNDMFAQFIECADPTGCGTGHNSMAWDFQACTEIQLPPGSDNVTDMFPPLMMTPQDRENYCMQRWGVSPRDSWMNLQVWGKDIGSASNIVFSNGDLDPWQGGGVGRSPGPSLVAAIVKGGAHHLDLRGHNDQDPIGVLEVRELEKFNIRLWVNSPPNRSSSSRRPADRL